MPKGEDRKPAHEQKERGQHRLRDVPIRGDRSKVGTRGAREAQQHARLRRIDTSWWP